MIGLYVTLHPATSEVELSKALARRINPRKLFKERIPFLMAVVYVRDWAEHVLMVRKDDEMFCNMLNYSAETGRWGFVMGGQKQQMNVAGLLEEYGIDTLDPIDVRVTEEKTKNGPVFKLHINRKNKQQ